MRIAITSAGKSLDSNTQTNMNRLKPEGERRNGTCRHYAG